jgi:hypothetical protein
MKTTISLERDTIKLKRSVRKIVIPMDPKEGKPWMESWDEDQEAQCLYQINNEQRDYVEPTTEGEILRESPMSFGHNSDSTLYNSKIENYKAHAKDCWSSEIIPKKHLRTCYSIEVIPKVYEKKTQQTPTLIPTDNQIRKPLRYNE